MEIDYTLLNDVAVCIVLLLLTFGLFTLTGYIAYYNREYCQKFKISDTENTQFYIIQCAIVILGIVSGIMAIVKIIQTVISTM